MYITRYEKKLIDDYINGNDIVGYNLEELEDNADFMREVLLRTEDAKMYYMCSNKLKGDLRFVLFLIEKFYKCTHIINDIIVNYFKINNNDIKRKEFELCLASLSLRINNEQLRKYQNLVVNVYCFEMDEYKRIIDRIKQDKLKSFYGIGFYFVIDRYGESNIIKNFFAQSMLDDIFMDYKLETKLHRKYTCPNEVEEYGINNFILDIVNMYDIHLKKYLEVKPVLMHEIYLKVKFYLRRWDKYDLKLAEDVLYTIDKYFEESKKDSFLYREEVMAYIVQKLKLQRLFNKADNLIKELNFSTNIPVLLDEEKLSVSEMITLLDLENIIKREVFGIDEVIDGNTKKLIKVDFGKNN